MGEKQIIFIYIQHHDRLLKKINNRAEMVSFKLQY